MKPKQLSIWTKEEMDIFAPENNIWEETPKQYRKKLYNKCLERASLSDEEKTRYGIPLNKERLVDFFNENPQEIGKNYYMNKGVPQMVLTSLTQYFKKEQKDLLLSDLIIFYKSIDSNAPKYFGNPNLAMFRKANNLKFFGISQYEFIYKYIQSLA
jgi:hypothetical protein